MIIQKKKLILLGKLMKEKRTSGVIKIKTTNLAWSFQGFQELWDFQNIIKVIQNEIHN